MAAVAADFLQSSTWEGPFNFDIGTSTTWNGGTPVVTALAGVVSVLWGPR